MGKGSIRLAEHPEIVPDVRKLFDDLKRVKVRDCRKPGGWTYVEISQLAVDETQRAGSCLVIVNTKDAARKIFESCRGSLEDGALFHLSTDMCPAHRKQILGEVTQRLEAKSPTLCGSSPLRRGRTIELSLAPYKNSLAGLQRAGLSSPTWKSYWRRRYRRCRSVKASPMMRHFPEEFLLGYHCQRQALPRSNGSTNAEAEASDTNES